MYTKDNNRSINATRINNVGIDATSINNKIYSWMKNLTPPNLGKIK